MDDRPPTHSRLVFIISFRDALLDLWILGNGHGEVHWSPSACPQCWLSSFWRTRDFGDVGRQIEKIAFENASWPKKTHWKSLKWWMMLNDLHLFYMIDSIYLYIVYCFYSKIVFKTRMDLKVHHLVRQLLLNPCWWSNGQLHQQCNQKAP